MIFNDFPRVIRRRIDCILRAVIVDRELDVVVFYELVQQGKRIQGRFDSHHWKSRGARIVERLFHRDFVIKQIHDSGAGKRQPGILKFLAPYAALLDSPRFDWYVSAKYGNVTDVQLLDSGDRIVDGQLAERVGRHADFQSLRAARIPRARYGFY